MSNALSAPTHCPQAGGGKGRGVAAQSHPQRPYADGGPSLVWPVAPPPPILSQVWRERQDTATPSTSVACRETLAQLSANGVPLTGARRDRRAMSMPVGLAGGAVPSPSSGGQGGSSLAVRRECHLTTLRALVEPVPELRELRAAAAAAASAGLHGTEGTAAALVARGFDARACCSRSAEAGTRNTSPRSDAVARRARPIFSGAHSFVSVRLAQGAGATRAEESVVVDPCFRQQFDIARPMHAYTELLAELPEVYVGYASDLRVLVRFLVSRAAESFAAQGMDVPPWRKVRAMHGKWLLAAGNR